MNGFLNKILFKIISFLGKKVSSVWIIVAILATGYIVCGAKSCTRRSARSDSDFVTNEVEAERELLDSNRRSLGESFQLDTATEDEVFGSLEPIGANN